MHIIKNMGMDEPRPRVDFSVNEHVRVKAGPFEGFEGIIDEIYAEKSKLRVIISMFGRDTPVELDFFQAEKLD